MTDDPIVAMAEVAFAQHEKGHLSNEQLIEMLERLVNARAKENGYAESFGLPFPERK